MKKLRFSIEVEVSDHVDDNALSRDILESLNDPANIPAITNFEKDNGWIAGVRGGLKAIQQRADIFNQEYVQATHTSKPQHWLDAALSGRQLVNILHAHGLIEDSWEEYDKQWKDQE